MPATFLLCYKNVLAFSTNMTRFKNYSYLIVDRKVQKPLLSVLKIPEFCSQAIYFPRIAKF